MSVVCSAAVAAGGVVLGWYFAVADVPMWALLCIMCTRDRSVPVWWWAYAAALAMSTDVPMPFAKLLAVAVITMAIFSKQE
jgi:hypothetical protein